MPPRTWTDEQLAEAVANSERWRQVCLALGLTSGGRAYKTLRQHAARLGLETSHLPGLVEDFPLQPRRFDDDELRTATAQSASYAEVLRRLGYRPSGGMHRFIKAHMKRLGLDTSHFRGQGWARGTTTNGAFRSRPLEEVLVNGSVVRGSRLLKRLIDAGLKARCCEGCHREEWEGKPIPLELDHVNGDPTDNRLENLRVLCPNCHALTETYCGRNRGRRSPTQRHHV